MFDLKVETSSRKEPEQRIGGKSVARHDLMLEPIERSFFVHILICDMVQLAGEGEAETEDRVWQEAPDDGLDPTKTWHEERPYEDDYEGDKSASKMSDLSAESTILHLDVLVSPGPDE